MDKGYLTTPGTAQFDCMHAVVRAWRVGKMRRKDFLEWAKICWDAQTKRATRSKRASKDGEAGRE